MGQLRTRGRRAQPVGRRHHATRSAPRVEARAVRVLVAEHDVATLSLIEQLLEASSGFTICAKESTAVGAVSRAIREEPNICLLHIAIPGGGMAAAWEISARLPDTKIVMLTTSPLGRELMTALAASGFAGYVRTDLSLERLPRVLDGVMNGEIVIPRAAVAQLAAEFRESRAHRRPVVVGRHSARLTSREWEVLGFLCDGTGTRGIATRLDISQATVRSHIAGALRKLDVPDRGAAVRLLAGDERRRR